MRKALMGFAILFGTLAVFALVKQPNVNDPEFWKGSHNQVFRPTGPKPEPTPVGGWEQFNVEMVPVMMNGQKRTALVLTPSKRQTRDAAMLAMDNGQFKVNE
jgi:hypothetical protein